MPPGGTTFIYRGILRTRLRLTVTGEAALGSCAQTAVDANKFFRRQLAFNVPEAGAELKCDLGKLFWISGDHASTRSRISIRFFVFVVVKYHNNNRMSAGARVTCRCRFIPFSDMPERPDYVRS
jgi:hypothetical protein